MRFLFVAFPFVLLLAIGVSGCNTASSTSEQEIEYVVGDFSLTERNGQTVSRSDLAGKVWVAAFIFTRCAGPCGQVTGTMAHLQHDLDGTKGVVLVSFTVDPEFDRPEILRNYADRFKADPRRWLFLTGEREQIYRLIGES